MSVIMALCWLDQQLGSAYLQDNGQGKHQFASVRHEVHKSASLI